MLTSYDLIAYALAFFERPRSVELIVAVCSIILARSKLIN